MKINEETGDEASGFLIERALDQLRADAWPDRSMTHQRRIKMWRIGYQLRAR